MSLVDTTDTTQTDALSFELELKHRPEKVWRALTDPVLLAEWLLPTVGLVLQPGAEFTLKTDPLPGWDGIVNCRFVEIEPQRKLRYTWAVSFGLHTEVTFTLTPTDEGTRLSLVQSGFRPDQKQNFGGARYGWKMMGGRLLELLARTS